MLKDVLRSELLPVISKTLGPDFLDFEITHPQKESFGDYSINLALKASKSLSRSPLEIANRLSAEISASNRLFEKVEVVPPGFVNLTMKSAYLLAEAGEVLERGDNYGRSLGLSGKKLMVEFAHPNTHKQFHIGHLRNISLGEALARLLEAAGAEVIRTNYQGDVGLHVAKALWGIRHLGLIGENRPLLERIEFLGKAYVAGHQAYEGEAKEAVVAINRKIYARDPEVMALWQKTREWSLEYFSWIYGRLGTHYERLYFESEVAGPGVSMTQEALKMGILTESEGAIIFDGTPYGLDKRVFLTSEKLPTYEAKELGLSALEFSEFGAVDKCIHVVGPEQQSFFKVTFKVEELLDREKFGGKQFHFVYGYVQLKEGKMSSRKGNIVTAVSVLDQAKEAIQKIISSSRSISEINPIVAEKIAEKVAVGAVKYSMLRGDPKNDIAFDLKESIALEGNSGPYLQYTYARASSVLRKSTTLSAKVSPSEGETFEGEELALLRTVYKFPEVVEDSALNYEPHLICNFLFDLAKKFNLLYNNLPILPVKSRRTVSTLNSNLRLVLTSATAQILKNGLYLLGIEAPEKM